MTLLLKLSPNAELTIQLIIVGIIGFLCLLFLHWLYDKISRLHRIKIANENCYDRRYADLQNMIKTYELHCDNYNYLKTQLLRLGQMGFKDHERTSVLIVEFYNRFKRFALDEINEPDEFSPESVFSEFNDI